ncbi:CopG family ribbon-helix-helix protein [Infirmifilum lucidum]|uniref:CopG family ribbon-helix-helix protein n=1 Tax=Infirmifilum lucidum TaxID=2776706 RepID=A0A7L9FJ83_9CREN|nr:CopG family ribbon-helix-helix protein [Infirmifilum lucidum]QOJ79083.1 CopG family ribbon-helix-helix protein [Infirmifilum lucidum]
MRRISVTLPDEVFKALEELEVKTGVSNRSRLVGDAVMLLHSQALEDDAVYAGSLVVVYDHSRGETVYGVVDAQHDYTGLIRGSIHVHLTEEKCVEVIAVHGRGAEIRGLASKLRRVSGVITVQQSLVKV